MSLVRRIATGLKFVPRLSRKYESSRVQSARWPTSPGRKQRGVYRTGPWHGEKSQRSAAEYTQLFLYRVPKANHDAFATTEGKLFAIFRRLGILSSDLYVLGDARIFRGFQDLRATLGATPEEEVWEDVDAYRDAADSLRVIAEIGKDPATGPLFAEVLRLATQGVLAAQGNANRLHP